MNASQLTVINAHALYAAHEPQTHEVFGNRCQLLMTSIG